MKISARFLILLLLIIISTGCSGIAELSNLELIECRRKPSVGIGAIDKDCKNFIVNQYAGGGSGKAVIPKEVVAFGYKKFCQLTGQEPYFNRLVNATHRSLMEVEYAQAQFLTQTQNPVMAQFFYHKKSKQLEILFNESLTPVVNAIDLSKVNME